MKILFLSPYPLKSAPSQRFRFEHFFKSIEERGWEWKFQSFFSENGWKVLYKKGFVPVKAWFIIEGYFRRVALLFKIMNSEFVFIHRELTPFGPPVFEWWITKVLKKKVIFDFDDAIWMNDGHDGKLVWWLKCRWKINLITKWSWKISAGNEFLADHARQYNRNVFLVPTVVDTEVHHPHLDPPRALPAGRQGRNRKLVIGWTGTHSTLIYLNPLIPVIHNLEKEFEFEFHVIANRDPNYSLKGYRFIKWNKETEIDDLSKFDIGLMPLSNEEWSKGKCGFKLIQYGALCIPSVASQVGVNSDIIVEGENGFFANSIEEWRDKIVFLLKNSMLRVEMGIKARKVINKSYSVETIKGKFFELFC